MARTTTAAELGKQDVSGQPEDSWHLSVGRKRGGAPGSAATALTLAALPDVHLVACGAVAGVLTVQAIKVSSFNEILRFYVQSGLWSYREAWQTTKS